MRRYEEYKPSLTKWVPSIPQNWKQVRGKSVFYNQKQLNADNTCENILSLTLKGVIGNNKENPIGLSPKDYCSYQIFEPNDLVFKLIDLENIRTSRVGLVPERGIMSPAYIRLCQRGNENIRYMYYQYFDLYLRNIFNGLGAGVRSTLTASDLLNLPIMIPPRAEQDQIVRYLDWQVSKINRLIAAKRKEIALLKEQKQRKITEVVVHGLKPNVPHKDTGIAWIGSIPAHWHCVALKRCATVKSGITLGKQYPVGTNLVSVPYLRVANVQDGFVNIETVTNLNVTPEEAAQYRLPRGCVLMTEGGDRDKLGRGCVWNGEIENCIHQNHIFAVTVNDKLLLNKWLEYVSACDIGRVYFDVTAIKTTNLACTNASKVMAFPIPLPPRDEQECIINELNRITSRFNDARESLEKQIEYLQELRILLISDVVTGQIDVRGIEVPKHESVDDVVAESEVEELEVE